jgi:hypothetical protein
MESGMKINRSALRVVAVLAVAAAAGQLVQGGASGEPAELATQLPVPTDITPVAAGPQDPVPPATMQLSPGPALPRAALELPAPAAPAPVVLPEAPAPVVVETCPVQLDLLEQPNAMIGLSLVAPCQADQRVVLRHAGLAVTGRTSASGAIFASIPAMDAAGEVSLLFADGTTARAALPVPGLAALRRFAVQWQADDAFQLHAFENGADYGQPGHVWAEAAQRPLPGEAQSGGFLTVLGATDVDLPLLAEVYTFPAAAGLSATVVVEAAVSDRTCGRELLGETLLSTGGAVTVTDLTLAMPDCSAKGDILVLKNLVPDLTIAAAN